MRGESLEEIARQMEVSVNVIRRDLKIIKDTMLQKLADNPEKVRQTAAHMLERAEEMYRTSWEALLASQGESVETRVTSEMDEVEEEYIDDQGETRKRKKQVPSKPKSTLIRKRQAGDPRWMERAGWAWQKMCELQGLLLQKGSDTPTAAAPTGETGVVLFLPTNGRDMHLQTNKPKKDETPKT